MTFDFDKLIGINMLTIRKGKPAEITEIGNLWTEFMQYNARFNDSFEIHDKAYQTFLKDMKGRCKNPDCHLSVADLDGKLIGYCYSYISEKPKFFKLKRFGFIGDLFVKEEHRRQGVGRQLVDDAMNFFENRNVYQIELLVAIGNEDTIKFWEEYGFKHLLTWMYKRT